MRTRTRSSATSKGLNPRIYKGLNDKRMAKGTGGDRLIIKQGETVTVQFLEEPSEMREFEMHQFQDGSRWCYVPCAGDDCPLCSDDDTDVSRTRYRFCANVYSFKEKSVKIMNGPKDLAGRIAFRYKKRPTSFLKRTWDVSMMATQPVSYDVEAADDRPVQTRSLKLLDLDKYIEDEMRRYFGDDMPSGSSTRKGRSAMDDDEDDEDDDEAEDDEFSEDELLDMEWGELKSLAQNLKIKLVDPQGEKRKRASLVRLILRKQ